MQTIADVVLKKKSPILRVEPQCSRGVTGSRVLVDGREVAKIDLIGGWKRGHVKVIVDKGRSERGL